MIALGTTVTEKSAMIDRYCAEHDIQKLAIINWPPVVTPTTFDGEIRRAPFHDSDKYEWFYPFLTWTDAKTLIVFDECLRLQNRYDIKYNCFRHYLQLTTHQIIFQHLPIIDTVQDFMILFDLDTRSRWKREKFRPDLLSEADIRVQSVDIVLDAIPVVANAKLQAAYDYERDQLFASIGLRDPHTIPRNLYLMSGKAKLAHIDPSRHYIGRNNRFKLPKLATFKEDAYPDTPYTVFEFCHNFIDFIDFLSLSRQVSLDVLVANLKVDQWYFERYVAWAGRVRDAYAAIQR